MHRAAAPVRRLLALAVIAAALGAAGAQWLRGGSAHTDSTGEERLIGWKGESHRSRVPTLSDKYSVDDKARGMWTETLSWRPRAFAIHNFMTTAEADELITIARPSMRRSTVVDSVTGESKVDPIRTSEQTFLNRGRYDLVSKIEERLSRVTMLPWYNGEDMQILKYQNGQKYDAHHDVGELSSRSGAQLAREGGHRVATALLYLSDVEEGGETAFPDSDWADPALSRNGEPWSDCADGSVAVHPRKGDVLVFWSILPDGSTIDPASMHAGCPVLRGTKWTGTKWVHAGPFRYSAPPPPAGASGGCRDGHAMCKAWASAGECTNNPGYMIGNGEDGACLRACKRCTQRR